MSLIKLTRKELFDQVWSQPMSKLAKNYGLSDVGLRKKCRKVDIPLPQAGYWVKKQFGKADPPPPLPPFDGDDEVVINAAEENPCPIAHEQYERAKDTISFEKLDDNRIQVASKLLSPHPLVAQAREILNNTKPHAYDKGILSTRGEKCLDIRASREILGRALRVMDALVKALEARGYKVSISAKEWKNGHITTVTLLGETLKFGLKESLKQIKRELTTEERKNTWLYREYDFIPSGRLSLSINEYVGDGNRKTWSDGKKQRIEDYLNDFIDGLVRAAVEIKARRLRWEEQERERQERERQRQEKARLKREEAERVQALMKETENWNRSQQIRAYIEMVKERAIHNDGGIEPEGELDRWLAWAKQQADHLDPLIESPPSILDEVDEDEKGYGFPY